MSTQAPVLEVFADVTCPFTHVGFHRLAAARAARGRVDPVLVVRAWPLEWVNGAAFEGSVVATKVAALRGSVAPDLFAGFDPAHFPRTSIPALAFSAAAARVDPRLGERAALAVRHALFEEGRDVADPAVLDALAAELAVPPVTADDVEQVRRDYDDGRARGVQGSPQFFTHGRGWFCPTLDIRKVGDLLEIEFDAEAFESFVAEVFAP
jgi:predicted DsbA family dithiol-disulfide isomerase